MKRLAALGLLPGCMLYGANAEHPTARNYAEIAVVEVASAALLGAMHDNTPGSTLNDQPYVQRSAEILGGMLLVDALMTVGTSIKGDGDH